jgi:hypothetical protein
MQNDRGPLETSRNVNIFSCLEVPAEIAEWVFLFKRLVPFLQYVNEITGNY